MESTTDYEKLSLSAAARFWEPRRILYNLILLAVVLTWLFANWQHFRPGFSLFHGFQILVLALLANACYCAAYLADLFIQTLLSASARDRTRWILWTIGTIFAFVLTNYWIADEIYPFVR
jgi:chromate transport protein ChrA